jgi:hypothetical protein
MRVLALGLLLLSVANCQSNVVFQRVLTGATNGTTTTVLRNVGQSVHQLVGIAWCTSTSAALTLYGDVNGTMVNPEPVTFGPNTLKIAEVAGLNGAAEEFSITGVGVYQSINLKAVIGVGCQVDAWYIGGAGSALNTRVDIAKVGGVQAATVSVATGANAVGDAAPVVSGGYSWGTSGQVWNPIHIAGSGTASNTALGTNGAPAPIAACDSSAVLSVAAANTAQLVSNTVAGSRVRVCSIVLSGSAAGTTVQLSEKAHGTCTALGTALTGAMIIGTSMVSMGNGLGQIFSTKTVDLDLCVTAVTGNLAGVVSYSLF